MFFKSLTSINIGVKRGETSSFLDIRENIKVKRHAYPHCFMNKLSDGMSFQPESNTIFEK